MGSISLAVPRLRRDQWDITQHPAKRKYLTMGRRWGKSTLGGALVLNVMRQHGKAAWLVPNYKNARPLWRYVSQVCAPHESSKLLDISKAEKIITTYLGGFLGIYSADNIDAIRSEAFNLVVVDESARVDGESKIDAVEGTLADYDGDELDISTPKGMNHFFVEWTRANTDTSGYSAAWHAPTCANPIPNIQKAYYRAKELLPARTFRQEFDAEFIEDGSFFTNVQQSATATAQDKAQANHEYVIGVDWARASGGDYSVFAVLDATSKSVAALVRLNGMPFDAQLMRLRALWSRFAECPIIAESNAMGAPLIERLQSEGLPVTAFTTTAATKHAIMTALQLALEQGELALLNDPVLIGELQAFEVKARAGLPSYGAPEGMHDDCVMSLALAYHGANSGVGILFEV